VGEKKGMSIRGGGEGGNYLLRVRSVVVSPDQWRG
jgi:hypothetical protein